MSAGLLFLWGFYFLRLALSLCSVCLSLCLSALISAGPHQPHSLSLPLLPVLPLSRASRPVYFYISYVVLLIRNPTYTASSCLSASQKLLSPVLICRLAGCFRRVGIIRTTVTAGGNRATPSDCTLTLKIYCVVTTGGLYVPICS